MLQDLNDFSTKATEISADICIIGGGAMGLTLAYALRNTTKKVLIIESGGEEISPKNQQLLDVEHSGLKVQFPGSTARIRALGGSSNCWAGFVMPFSKSVIDQWPMRAKGMEKYWPKVHDFLMLKGKWQDFYSPKEFLGNDFPEEMYSDFNMEYRQVHPLRIWAHYKDELIKSKNVNIIYNANATNLELNADKSKVMRALAHSLDNNMLTVSANFFVLAASGIGNSALLLNFDRKLNSALLKDNKIVGKYFTDHAEIHDRFIPNHCFPTINYPKEKPPFSPVDFIKPHFRLLDTNGVPKYIDHSIQFKKSPVNPEIQCSEGLPNFDLHVVTLGFGPTPYEKSEILLSERKNEIGNFIPSVNWTLEPQDYERLTQLAKEIERIVIKKTIGRIPLSKRFADKQLDSVWDYQKEAGIYNGKHWMGGTRMGSDPKTSVVDQNCKLWTSDNLYVTGASVFPTFGWPGPTYTALGLAFRLAEHLS